MAQLLSSLAEFDRPRLADLVDRLTNGFVGPTRDIYVKAGVPYLLARHVRNGRLSFDRQTFVSPTFNEKYKKSTLKAGDVLLVQSGHIGHAAVVGSDHDGHNCHAMIVITPKPSLLLGEFLSYFFSSPEMRLAFEAMRSGSTVPHLTCAAVRELRVPLPALDEQRREVATLDEALEGIAKAKAIAVTNRQLARDLAARQRELLFAAGAGHWPVRPLAEVATILNGFAFKSTDFRSTPGVRSIKITNVGVNEFVAEAGNYLPAEFCEIRAGVAVPQGCIVFALTRTVIAGGLKVAMVPPEFDGALLNQRVAAIQPHASHLATTFLYAYLSTSEVMHYVKSRVNTLMQPNLAIADLRLLPVPVPALCDQHALLGSFQKIEAASLKLQSVYLRKLAALDELKHSLLHQAFSGGLSR